MKSSKQKYHVKIITRTYDDDGVLICEEVVYEQDTWAVSERQAENNARHNSGYPYHGRASIDECKWSKVIDAEVVPVFCMTIDGRPVYV